MNLRQIEAFHAIMVTGSVTAAARMLNVTQPAVSTILKHCESQLKMPLFVRLGGRLQPTKEAEVLFRGVAEIFERLDAFNRTTQDLAGGRLGTLSLAGSFPVANGLLSSAVASFIACRPNIKVVLQSMSTPQVLNCVLNREVELGVAYEQIVNREVETELLVNTQLACVLPPDHPLASRETVQAADLKPYPIITYLPQSLFRTYLDPVLKEAGVASNIKVQVSLSMTGIMLAQLGVGVAIVEPYLLGVIDRSKLVSRPLSPRIDIRTLLFRNRSAPKSLITEEFVAHLKEMTHELYN
ncbi:LysR family transcriptional regulator [Microvirga brassicacearum]|uniref:LysR family transcriptional regulator n=1 Tax=Microvirga brassicacearum TaxID=2580413 RepID=A0A5N3PAM2_9HYPH|nr:LysR family transcriptional regulator [Microvirga brassicacearum]KAB0266802.1 LysR family transcriptional regulator [Microvirga brassicacearum]